MISHPLNHANNYSNDNHLNHFKKKITRRLHKLNNQIQSRNLQILKNFIQPFTQLYSKKIIKEQMKEKFNIITTQRTHKA